MTINWDSYYSKHCARYYGWLPACRVFKQKRKNSLRYFTLCGEKAIDVFMLEMENVLQRDKNGMLSEVIICEKQEAQIPEILRLVRPPMGKDAIIPRALESVLTFEEDADTDGKTIYDYDTEEAPSRQIREKLIIKDFAQRLKNFFPFDIINFDPCNNLFSGTTDSLYLAFKKIFELQESANSFLLFLTSPVSHIHQDFQDQFRNDLESNVARYPKVGEILRSETGTLEHDELEETKRIAICMAKSIVSSTAKENGWNSGHKGIYIYENKDGRRMLSSVAEFNKAGPAQDENKYIEDIIHVIRQMPSFHSYRDSLQNRDVVDHLNSIVEYRDNFSNQFRI